MCGKGVGSGLFGENKLKFRNAKKPERGDPLGFFNISSVGKHKKIEENKNCLSRRHI